MAKQSRGRSCFLYGCITAVIVLVLLMVGLWFGARYAVTSLANRFTDTQPMDLPTTELTPAEQNDLKERVEAFVNGLASGQEVEPLVMESDEVNAFIASRSDLAQFRDKIHVSLQGSQVQGQISIPLSDLGLDRLSRNLGDRYLNASGTFDVFLRDGGLVVNAESLEVKGEPIPASVMTELRQQNLAEDVDHNPDAARFLNQLQSIQVEESRLILTPKPPEQR